MADSGFVDVTGEPLRNRALVEAMRAVAMNDSQQTRAMLYQLMLESTLVVATPDVRDLGPRILGRGEQVVLLTSSDADGPVLPVFTSVEAVLAWQSQGCGVLALPARSLFEMAVANGGGKMVINPGSQTWGIISGPELGALARGRLPLTVDGVQTQVVAGHEPVRIGPPTVLPPARVLAAVRAAAQACTEVSSARLCLLQQGSLPPEPCVVLYFDKDVGTKSRDHTVQTVSCVACEREPGAAALLFMPAGGGVLPTFHDSDPGVVIFTR